MNCWHCYHPLVGIAYGESRQEDNVRESDVTCDTCGASYVLSETLRRGPTVDEKTLKHVMNLPSGERR